MLNRIDISALVGSEFGLLQKSRHPKYAVHRRTDLMAHRRQKTGLRARGSLGPVARVCQGVFKSFALGDVAPDALHLDETAVVITDGVVLPGDPPPPERGLDVLIVAHTGAAGVVPG